MDTMAAIRETFFQECEEQLGELEVGLNAMEEGVADSETVNAVFRAVHSIKGGAGAFKLDRLVRFAHTFETTLDLIHSPLRRRLCAPCCARPICSPIWSSRRAAAMQSKKRGSRRRSPN